VIRPHEASGGLPPVRWLAERCGVSSSRAPQPRLASELLRYPEYAKATQAYLRWWMRHPDADSTFERSVRPLSDMPDEALIPALARRGYDGLLYLSQGEIGGHVFFQDHGADLCGFSAAVAQSRRGGKLWATLCLDFVAYAAQRPQARRASVGTGGNLVARLLWKLLRAHVYGLGWRLSDDGWIHFSRADTD